MTCLSLHKIHREGQNWDPALPGPSRIAPAGLDLCAGLSFSGASKSCDVTVSALGFVLHASAFAVVSWFNTGSSPWGFGWRYTTPCKNWTPKLHPPATVGDKRLQTMYTWLRAGCEPCSNAHAETVYWERPRASKIFLCCFICTTPCWKKCWLVSFH